MATARVHAVELDLDEREVAALGGVLTADELLRAGRMRAEEQRRRAIVTRAALRKLLARETGRKPEEIAFSVGAHGKPRLDDTGAAVRFNLSHSAGLGLIGTAGDVGMGADGEETRPRSAPRGAPGGVFPGAGRGGGEGGGEPAFYRHWVAK